MRVIPGPNPSETALTEIYELPAVTDPKADVLGFSPRGGDVDRNGVMWSALSSGHLASFDRRKCKGPLNGPKATGQHCREGWTFYPEPLPQFKGVTDNGSVEGSYYTWVDQFDTFGLGANIPDQYGQCVGRAPCVQGWQLGRAARAVSARVLHEMDGRPHRRSRARMEGQRVCGRRSARARRSTWRRGRGRRAK